MPQRTKKKFIAAYLNKTTQDCLKKMGKMDESYNSIIVCLIDFYEGYMRRDQPASNGVII